MKGYSVNQTESSGIVTIINCSLEALEWFNSIMNIAENINILILRPAFGIKLQKGFSLNHIWQLITYGNLKKIK